ncbi:MAG TPA: DUF3313 family protein [Steroidobacteraceae bacterium]|nr:DUF3313 family protein [Steroidobacteraceae bacterium]
MTLRLLLLAGLAFGAAMQEQAQAQDSPEVTDEGLMRVPSSRKSMVYRLPTATFDQYRGIVLDPIKIEFKKGWEREHREMSDRDMEKLRGALATAFLDELKRELVTRGGFQLVDEPARDVLRVSGRLFDTDVTAPKASSLQGQRTYVRNAGSMRVEVELRDSQSGLLIGRIVSQEKAPDRHDDLLNDYRRFRLPRTSQPPNSMVANIADFSLGFANSARYTHEAISVARAAKREEQSRIKSEN